MSRGMVTAKILRGLPPYGPMATPFPSEWGRLGGEGTVVEFRAEAGAWVGNFQPGLGKLECAGDHPDGRHAIVMSAGDLWVVDPNERTAQLVLPGIEAAFEVQDPNGWIYSREGLALARLGPAGLIWHTRRLSWDGFAQLTILGAEMRGLAWSPFDDQWQPFRVNIRTGMSRGGSYGDEDSEGWEKLA